MDILLILGNVSPKQYAPIKRAMIARGMKPRVFKLGQDLRTYNTIQYVAYKEMAAENPAILNKLFDRALFQHQSRATLSEVRQEHKMLVTYREKVCRRICHESLDGHNITDIKAVVERVYDGNSPSYERLSWDGSFMAWLDSQLPTLVPFYGAFGDELVSDGEYEGRAFEDLD